MNEPDVVKELILNILLQAVKDYQSGRTASEDYYKDKSFQIKKIAKRWLRSKDCEIYCEALNVDYDYFLKGLGLERREN